jgi:hypothetical protein
VHIVYKVTLGSRLKAKTPPYFYIGSKSNCEFDGKNIYDRKNKKYYGSSKSKLYKDYLKIETDILLDILYTSDYYNDCLEMERKIQIDNNVVISNEYFNCSIATISNLTNPEYISARQLSTGKIARIHKDEINEDWVGVSSGKSWFNNGKENKLFKCDDHPIGWEKGRLGNFLNNSKNFTKNISQEELSKRMVVSRKGNGNYKAWNKDKTGLYKHTDTAKEKMKIAKQNKGSGTENSMFGKVIINNGIQNTTIRNDQKIPDGWVKGRLWKKNTAS